MNELDPWKEIPEDKKDNILQASIEEFAAHGYLKASTNQIIKKANISKGLLFHYFGSKKKLYLAILDHITELFIHRFYDLIEEDSDDIFDKIIIWTKHKFTLLAESPLEYQILMDAYINIPVELKDELTTRHAKQAEINMGMLLKEVDYSKFKKKINPQKAIEFIFIAIEGLGNKYIKMYKGKEKEIIHHLEQIQQEIEEYIYMMKNGLYAEE